MNIGDEDWAAGWRRTLEEAVDAFFANPQTQVSMDEAVEIKIHVRKRSDNPIHDYLVGP
jgi:hypothetical protein